MFVADTPGSLDEVEHYTRSLAGAETNVATGLARLGHSTGWIGRVGDDPFGRFIHTALSGTGIDTAARHASTRRRRPAFRSSRTPAAATLRSSTSGRTPPVPGSPGTRRWSATSAAPGTCTSPVSRWRCPPAPATSPSGRCRSPATTASRCPSTPTCGPVLWPSTQEMIDVTHQMVAARRHRAARGQRGAGAARHQGPDRDRPDLPRHGCVHRRSSRTAATAPPSSPGTEVLHRNVFPVEVVDTVGAGDGFAAGFISGTLDRLTTARLPAPGRRGRRDGHHQSRRPGRPAQPARADHLPAGPLQAGQARQSRALAVAR